MAHSDYILTVCLDREDFQAIAHIFTYKQQQMMVFVESRRLLWWACKQLSHIVRTYPQKIAAIKTTGTTSSITSTTALEPEVYPDNQEKGWTLVTRKKKTSSPATSPAEETIVAITTEVTTTEVTTTEITTTPETTTDSTTTQPSSPHKKQKQKEGTL